MAAFLAFAIHFAATKLWLIPPPGQNLSRSIRPPNPELLFIFRKPSSPMVAELVTIQGMADGGRSPAPSHRAKPYCASPTRRGDKRSIRQRPVGCQGPRARQTRAGNCRSRAASHANGGPTGILKIHAGRSPARPAAAAQPSQSARNFHDPLPGQVAR